MSPTIEFSSFILKQFTLRGLIVYTLCLNLWFAEKLHQDAVKAAFTSVFVVCFFPMLHDSTPHYERLLFEL